MFVTEQELFKGLEPLHQLIDARIKQLHRLVDEMHVDAHGLLAQYKQGLRADMAAGKRIAVDQVEMEEIVAKRRAEERGEPEPPWTTTSHGPMGDTWTHAHLDPNSAAGQERLRAEGRHPDQGPVVRHPYYPPTGSVIR